MTMRALGVCYYPEHWPEPRWAEDAALMAKSGISWVRIGEFAWSRIEPRPGVFVWDWLDRAVATLAAAGLKIVMGTPSATPPRWLLTKHPDMLPVDAYGQSRRFGSRRHYDMSHKGFVAEAVRITAQMAERYGRHPAVQAWQLDNEYGCHDTTLSYSPAAAAAFRRWLHARYGTIEALNAAWGNIFWSMEYGSFDEIDPPNATVTEANPSHRLDFQRFSSDQTVRFNRALADAVRPHSPGRPLGHNYMGRTLDFDHFAVGADLEIATWDSYPLGFLEDRVEADADWRRRFARQGDPDFQAFHHDLYRAVGRGRWWVMEQQPGPVNWAPYNPDPAPGIVRLWAWEAFAHSAEVVSWFRWRQAPFAQEQMHAGLLRPDGEPAPALAAVASIAGELANRPQAESGPADAALIVDYESAWMWSIQPQGRRFDYFNLVFAVYRALRRAGLSIDIVPPDQATLGGYQLAAIPGLGYWRQPLIDALRRFAGIALLGPRSGAKTPDFQIPASLPPGLPIDLLDAKVARVESLRPDLPVPLEGGGQFEIWREIVEGGAEVRERTTDGHPAVLAQDAVRYLCGWPDAAALNRLVREACREAGLAPLDLPDGLRVRRTDGGYMATNYDVEPVDLDAHLGALGFKGRLAGCDVAFVP